MTATDRDDRSSVHVAIVDFEYESVHVATIVAESVGREVGEMDDDRSWTTLSRENATVTIEIAADDLVALRAAVNTWFSLVDVAERAVAAGESPASSPGE